MNLFVGANASGKSNFLDLLRVLQGIGNGFTISEILDGKPKSVTSAVWDGIRGGSARACFAGAGEDGRNGEVTIEVHGRFASGPGFELGRDGGARMRWASPCCIGSSCSRSPQEQAA